jgi:hypothetical protein
MKKLIISGIIITSMALSWYAFAREYRAPESKKSETDEALLVLDNNEGQGDFTDDEKAVLKELKNLLELYSSKTSFYLSGTIQIDDPVDSSQVNGLSHFEFLKSDKIVYYKNDEQESLNTDKYYAVADREAKKIIVSLPKEAKEISPIPFSIFSKNFKNDGYSIEKSVENNKTTIKLICENHITCKEIRIEYDAVTNKPSLLLYRFTDFDYPEDKTRDKIMSIQINQWEADGKEKDYKIPELITITQGTISSAKGFEEYEILNRIN